MSKIIRVNSLTKQYKIYKREEGLGSAFKSIFKRNNTLLTAVNSVDFEVERGDIHALLGPNGSGKSTMIKMLSGILYPTQGDIDVLGYNPWKQRKLLVGKIGVLFGQKTQLNWDLPAIDTFMLCMIMYNKPKARFIENMNYLIDLFQIHDIVRKPVRTLSLGERMKCEFTCVLLHEPDLVFLDEPTIGLDILSKDVIRTFIKDIRKEKGVSIILTTHDMADVENLCDKVTIINHGSVVYNNRFENLVLDYGKSKSVKLNFSEPISNEQAALFNLKMKNQYNAYLTVSNDPLILHKTLSLLFEQLPIKDFEVKSTEIDIVIKQIYQKKQTT